MCLRLLWRFTISPISFSYKPSGKVPDNHIITTISNSIVSLISFSLLQTISVVVSPARRGTKDRSHDGDLRTALLSTKSRYIHQHGHMLCAQLRNYNAKYLTTQSICKHFNLLGYKNNLSISILKNSASFWLRRSNYSRKAEHLSPLYLTYKCFDKKVFYSFYISIYKMKSSLLFLCLIQVTILF